MVIRIAPSVSIDEADFDEQFVRASGPGGQNVNKVSTAVRLRFDIGRASLPDEVKARLVALAGSKLSRDGVLMIDAREHRTQAQNREAARARLVDLLRQAARRPRVRRPTRPTRAARDQRIKEKLEQGARKRARAKPADD